MYREGVDGTWSTFEIHVGNPQQVARVLPATSWQETWVIYGAAQGACNTSVGVASDCAATRGGFFESSSSTTWVDSVAGDDASSQYFLDLNTDLGYNGVGLYGMSLLT